MRSMTALASLLAFVGSSASAATYYDGESTLLCTVFRMQQCETSSGCETVQPSDVGAGAAQWIVDFKKKTLKRSDPNAPQTSKITSVQYTGDTLYAQSIELANPKAPDGVAWSLSVSDPDGAMTLTASGRSVGFYADGACVPMR